MHLDGKKALVLGASRGIGRTIAAMLADAGVALALPWFDWPESSEEMVSLFAGHFTCRTDLRDPEEVSQLAKAIRRQLGGLDILINNIERGGMPVVHGGYEREVNQEQWRLEMETTLQAKHLAFNTCLPMLRESGDGAVVNISSVAALVGRSGPAGLLFSDGYAAANRGVGSLTETWARLAAPAVRVNEIMLGMIDGRHGPGTRGWDLLTADQRAAVLRHTLMGRTGTPEEVAALVRFILEQADYMTGSVIRLDGGYALGGAHIPPMPDGVV